MPFIMLLDNPNATTVAKITSGIFSITYHLCNFAPLGESRTTWMPAMSR